jgi:2-C-methyl-D-erythritol 4-phosphate cytidylyltransferase
LGSVEYDVPPALGAVLEQDRGSLPFALIHGEALVVAAVWSLGEAGATPVDTGTPWSTLAEAGEPLVLHDSLCPMTPPEFIAACLARAREHACVVVGVRPVTDTVKEVEDGLVGATVDRDSLVSVASPVVLPAEVVSALDALPSSDFPALVTALRRRFPVELVQAPPTARRVASVDDVRVLEALTAGSG